MPELTLRADEAAALRDLAQQLADDMAEDPPASALLRALAAASEQVPERLRTTLALLRVDGLADGLRIRGLDVGAGNLPPTPVDWRAARDSGTRWHNMLILLLAARLGEPFGWEGQQAGRWVNDVIPVEGHEKQQINSGSREAITWHTEDAFQESPSDYLGLLCLRNPDGVATGMSCARDWVPDDRLDPLFETPIEQVPDLAYEGDAQGRSGEPLFGDPEAPYVRLDPYFVRRPISPEVESALKVLDASVERSMVRVNLQPGELLLLDNFRAVHSRESFAARFDGTDRWVKRVCISRDGRGRQRG